VSIDPGIWRTVRRYAPLAMILGIQVLASVLVPSRAPSETPRAPAPVLEDLSGVAP
jgi:hypothetical protein